MFKFLKEKFSALMNAVKGKAKEKAKEVEAKPEEKKRARKEKVKEEAVEKKEEKIEVQEEKAGFFAKIRKKFTTITFSEKDFEEIWQNFEISLLENNVALEVVEKIKEQLKKSLVNVEIKKDEIEETAKSSLREILSDILIESFDLLAGIKKKLDKPYVILFFGINGSGKTTTIAKLAYLLKKNKMSCVMAASDTFRAASIEQLEKHGDKLGVKVIKHDYGSDPTSVAFDAVKYAKLKKVDVVLIDTAGRMHTKENLIREMEKISRVIKPDLKIFVGESITGNDATQQARTFNEAVGIDAIILSKADVDEKAGTILSVGYVTGKPILFLGVGQGMGDLKLFSKEEFLKNLGL